MSNHLCSRREILRMVTALGAATLPTVRSRAASARAAYDPAARVDIRVSEVEFRRNGAGRILMARVYQPLGAGPFPTVLDLHGGAWNTKDRRAEEPMDRALALDDNVLPAVQEKFAATYKAAGGDCQYELFEGCEHEWVAKPGPQTDRAREMVKAFIGRQVNKKGR